VTSSGGCLCGAVRFDVHGQLRGVLVCHCVECRRWCGQAWAATAARRDELVLLDDRSLRWVASPASDARARRGFCGDCGSCLFWDAPGRDTVSIAAGSLDSPEGLAVVGHTYVGQAATYEVIPQGVPAHAGLPS
jgi:hypothetical protein